jgi:phosphatidate cytidylyltransferase
VLWKRIATAAVLIPLLIASILLSVGRTGGWPFLLLCAVAAGLCADEGFRMFLHGERDRAGGVALAVLVFFSAALLPGSFGVPAILVCILLSVFHVLPGAADPSEKARRAATLCLGAVYVGGLLSTYPRTLLLPRGEHWVLLGILAVAAGDTMAYFTGRAIGRRKLAPAVSPNKTVEGAVGGLLGSVGQAGDLFESLIKRAAGVKDSGTLLPGHGGILDRADGILGAGPVLYLFAALSPLAGVGA